jgi:trans-aconitate methyltransferase
MTNHFDKHAKTYDAVFTNSSIGKAQRNRVYHFLEKSTLSKEKLNILELNCGTGEDAAYFHSLGHKIIATDISEKMISIASEKHPHISFKKVDITTITSEMFSEKFDLIFSNFGGLNCLSPEEIEHFIGISDSLLNPNGKMALVLMPKSCLWERFYFLIKRQTKKAFRRNTDNAVLANVDGVQVPTWYYNPKQISRLADKNFTEKLVKPVGISIPPSYLESFFTTKKRFLKLLIWKERFLSNSFWAKYADHFLIVLQKK